MGKFLYRRQSILKIADLHTTGYSKRKKEVCRNENIDSSNAGIAKDLRVLVRERIKEGDTNEEVLDFITDRYGEYVLLNPKISFQNLLLWISGPLFLLIGGVISWRYTRVKHPEISQKLSDDEKIRLKEIMDD